MSRIWPIIFASGLLPALVSRGSYRDLADEHLEFIYEETPEVIQQRPCYFKDAAASEIVTFIADSLGCHPHYDDALNNIIIHELDITASVDDSHLLNFVLHPQGYDYYVEDGQLFVYTKEELDKLPEVILERELFFQEPAAVEQFLRRRYSDCIAGVTTKNHTIQLRVKGRCNEVIKELLKRQDHPFSKIEPYPRKLYLPDSLSDLGVDLQAFPITEEGYISRLVSLWTPDKYEVEEFLQKHIEGIQVTVLDEVDRSLIISGDAEHVQLALAVCKVLDDRKWYHQDLQYTAPSPVIEHTYVPLGNDRNTPERPCYFSDVSLVEAVAFIAASMKLNLYYDEELAKIRLSSFFVDNTITNRQVLFLLLSEKGYDFFSDGGTLFVLKPEDIEAMQLETLAIDLYFQKPEEMIQHLKLRYGDIIKSISCNNYTLQVQTSIRYKDIIKNQLDSVDNPFTRIISYPRQVYFPDNISTLGAESNQDHWQSRATGSLYGFHWVDAHEVKKYLLKHVRDIDKLSLSIKYTSGLGTVLLISGDDPKSVRYVYDLCRLLDDKKWYFPQHAQD